MRRPVVGIVTTWFERGAAYVSHAYREALQDRFEVAIYARGGERPAEGDARWDGDGVWRAAADHGPELTEINRADFECWMRQRQVELVLFNEQQWWPPVLWARQLGARTVAYVDYYTPDSAPWFRAYDALWCNTRRHFSVFRDHPGARYIPWGTDLELFGPVDKAPAEEITFFHSAGMGGINLRKGTDLLVEAFQQVSGPARLVIHSQVPAAAYGALSPLLDRDSRIQFVEGTVPAPGLYHRGDVYVYPTRLEGIGLTVAEALACGLPVITTDVAPCSEFVRPEVNGWLVPVARTRRRRDGYYWPESECDVPALAALMQQCVERRTERPLWRRRARQYAVTHLNWRKNSSALAEEVGRILSSPSTVLPRPLVQAIIRAHPARRDLVGRLRRRATRQLASLCNRMHLHDTADKGGGDWLY